VVDLGCGTGNLTVELHERLQATATVGVDSSESMLARARVNHGDVPGLTFTEGNIETWLGEGLDLVFANASLQWVDDHLNVLARMRTALVEGGQLAFQVPSNFRHPSHVLARQVANEAPFIDALEDDVPEDRGRFVLSPEIYADLLYELGARKQVVRMEVYGHELSSTSDVVEWVMGTLLTPYRKRLSAELFTAFVERYRERLLEELGDREPYFYGFRRILCWAHFQ
jgi:trans-aconitate 2-methyltransferase